MVLHLYGFSKATCTQRVATVLHEKGVPFVFHPIDIMKGEQKSAEYLEKQPFGQVPYIDDDGFVLYESRAICQYVALKYADRGAQLIPTDLKGQALFYQAASTETANFDPYAQAVVKEKVFKPMFGKEPDQKAFDDALAILTSKLDVYEKILSKQKYLAGDEITLADLYHLPYASLLPLAGTDVIQARPNVARWYNDISSRPSWQVVKETIESTA